MHTAIGRASVLLAMIALGTPSGVTASANSPGAPGSRGAQATPDVAAQGLAIIKQAAAAMGGADKLAAIKDITVKGDVILRGPMGEMKGDSVAHVLYPDKIKSTINLPMGEMVQGYDGRTAWVQMAGQSQALPASMNAEMERSIATSGGVGIVRMALDGDARVTAAGTGEVEGRPSDIVVWTLDEREIRLFFDAETHLLAKLAFRGETPQGPADLEVIVGDHRSVGGVKIPWKVVGLQAGQEYLRLTATDIRLNTGLDAASFAKP